MSFVPSYFDYLLTHLQQEERRRMISSIAVTAAPEHWLSLEAAALLDTNRERFGLEEYLDHRQNVPRWLIARFRLTPSGFPSRYFPVPTYRTKRTDG